MWCRGCACPLVQVSRSSNGYCWACFPNTVFNPPFRLVPLCIPPDGIPFEWAPIPREGGPSLVSVLPITTSTNIITAPPRGYSDADFQTGIANARAIREKRKKKERTKKESIYD